MSNCVQINFSNNLQGGSKTYVLAPVERLSARSQHRAQVTIQSDFRFHQSSNFGVLSVSPLLNISVILKILYHFFSVLRLKMRTKAAENAPLKGQHLYYSLFNFRFFAHRHVLTTLESKKRYRQSFISLFVIFRPQRQNIRRIEHHMFDSIRLPINQWVNISINEITRIYRNFEELRTNFTVQMYALG